MGDRQDRPGGEATLDAVFAFVAEWSGVGRHFIRSGSQKSTVVTSRALAGLLLEWAGWSRRATAAALGMASHGSVIELLDAYRGRTEVVELMRLAALAGVVGNSTAAESASGGGS